MKRKKDILMVVLIILILAVTGIVAYSFQKNKESTSDRVSRIASETDAKKADASETENGTEDDTEDKREGCGDNILMKGCAQIEMLSVDILEGEELANETKYPVQYFSHQRQPVAEYTNELKDWNAIYAEAPELEKILRAEYGVYTADEKLAAREKYADIEKKYTQTVNVTNRIYFVKCRITNVSSTSPIETLFPMDVIYKSEDTDEQSYYEALRYFDKPVYTEGEDRKRYFTIKLDAGETMECTLGLAVPSDIRDLPSQDYGEHVKHYYGELIASGTIKYDPSLYPNYVDLDALPKTE
jgi:hypothetical protein